MTDICQVKGCDGVYETRIISYVNLDRVDTPEYEVSVEEYDKLENKKGYNRVINKVCNRCGDDLFKRLELYIKSHINE